ncbi:MAG: SusC/RagA family TonB-linked outer membrane protein [Prevotella sp.]|nr:SusC/RagA family TonB-linked outer membrane protein [Prevotella sp.]
MKHKILYMSALLALTSVTPAAAQIETGQDSLVNVAFRKVAADDVLGGVSSVNYRELMNKNYNTYSLDNLQGYVAGFNGNGMWGFEGSSDFSADNVPNGMLVLIDGVPRAANNVKPDEIETVTFLKGAQAVVLYGSRAAKGAVLITTKRGQVTNGLKVNVRANTGWNVAKSYPEYLGSAEYMTLYNEAFHNDNPLLPLPYSDEDIYNYASGLNPYRYPNVNFYSSDYIKKSYNRSDVTAEIEGGNERAKFYANVSYYRQGDFLNFGEAEDNYVDRFNVRGNVDMKINNFISAYVNANATYYNSRGTNGAGFWSTAATLRPNRISPLIPLSYLDQNAVAAQTMLNNTTNLINGCFLGGTQSELTNVFGDIYAAGYNTWTSRQFQFDAGVNVDLNSLLKGLSFHALVGVDYATTYSTSFNNTYATFEPNWRTYNGQDVIVALNNHDTVDKKSGVQNISGSTDNQTVAFNAHFDYNRTFGGVHNVSALAVVNGYQQSVSGVYHKLSNANLGFQADYNYDHRYYASLAIATPWSARLPEGHRAGVSPSLTLGWNIAKEQFMQNQNIFDELKLSASLSDLKTDMGIDDFYMYQATYQWGGWWDWNGETGHNDVQSKRGGNDDFGYLHRKEFSVSLHAALLQRALTADFSFFTNKMTGGVIASNQLPSYFKVYYPESSFLPYINFNEDTRTGFELALKYKKDFGDFGFQAGLNLTHYTTNAAKRDDTSYADSYQYRQGKPLDAIWGYECLGFFQDEADIANSPAQKLGGTTVRPGDLKYKDQNNDGIIDTKDQVYLGKGGWYGAPTTLGINLTLKYKNFTLFMLGVGGFGGHAVKNSSYWWIDENDKYSAVVRGRWTPETAATATYPRLTSQSGANNFTTSDFWLYSTSRFDLAKVQLTYDLPKSLFDNIKFIKGASVYASGNSLLTIAKERELMEMNVGSAPQARFYNLGVQVAF